MLYVSLTYRQRNFGNSPAFFLLSRSEFVRERMYIRLQEPKEAPMKSEPRNSINHEKISALAELLADKLIAEVRKRALEKHENFPKEAA